MSREALLFANEAFYRAFADGDADAMAALWAERLPLACLHPGREALVGREAVLASWRAILEAPPEIAFRAPRAFDYGASGFVLCWEIVGDSHLIATNVFAQEDGHWRMVHHQAGPTRDTPPPPEADETPPTIN